MRDVEISYALTPPQEGAHPPGYLLRNPMMDVLQALRTSGSISGAARALDLSYRHVWGQLKEWEAGLGQPLIVWERGQAARLTPFGERLLMAERLAQARLGPQIEALRAELVRAFSMAFDESDVKHPQQVLTLYASHDHALTELQTFAAAESRPSDGGGDRLHLDIRFSGSVDAIRALNEGRCELAGFHMQPLAERGSLSARTYRPLLKPGTHKIIGFARRSQGLIVARGNPLRLRDMRDVAEQKARFVNRSLGTGTRLLLDELLLKEGLTPDDIVGYTHTERSHAAVAQAVASGQADVGLGSAYAAASLGLYFVPLTEERYFLVCLKSALEQAPMKSLLKHLRSRRWQDHLNRLSGYAVDHCGEVAAMKRLLPWWD